MARRSFNGSAVPTTLSGSISNSVTAVPVTDGNTYPDGSAGPFFVVLDKGLVGEEKILVTTRVGNSFTVVTRAQDGTAASAHPSLASVNHCFTAVDADEANAHVNATAGVHGVTGALAGVSDTQTLTNKTISGASNTFSNIAQSAVIALAADLALKAADSAVVHNTGAENVAGVKTFSDAPVVPAAAFPESAVASLVADLAAKATDSLTMHLAGTETVTGDKTFTGALNRDPLLGISNPGTTGTATALVTVGSVTVTIPTGCKRVRITGIVSVLSAAGVGATIGLSGMSTVQSRTINHGTINGDLMIIAYDSNPTPGAKTYNVQVASTTGTAVNWYVPMITAEVG